MLSRRRGIFVALILVVVAASLASETTASRVYARSPGCVVAVSARQVAFPTAGGTATIWVWSDTPSCTWPTTASDSWISAPVPSTGTNFLTVTVGPTAASRAGNLNIGGLDVEIRQPNPGCQVNVSPNYIAIPRSGGTATVTVTTDNPACKWSREPQSSLDDGLTSTTVVSGTDLGGGSYAGNVTLSLTFQRWLHPHRGTIVFGGAALTIDQAPSGGDRGDYDGDGLTDLAIYRADPNPPYTSNWYVLLSSSGYTTMLTRTFGETNDTPAVGDYDGDGVTDLAFSRSLGSGDSLQFQTLTSSSGFATGPTSTVYYPFSSRICGATPVPTSSGRSTRVGRFGLELSPLATNCSGPPGNRNLVFQYLASTGDYAAYFNAPYAADAIPVQSHYGKATFNLTPAVYHTTTGIWEMIAGFPTQVNQGRMSLTWGAPGDLPVPGDYDGDGYTDPAVYRPNTGVWYILQSATSYRSMITQQWGAPDDIPVPGDYDGDGLLDPAIWRPSDGMWHLLLSSAGYQWARHIQWGLAIDTPIPGNGQLVTVRPR